MLVEKPSLKLTFVFLLLLPVMGFTQDIPELVKNGKDQWDKKEWRKANTARFSFYMNKQIRESIRLMNLARMHGSKFSDIYIEPIEDKTGYEYSLIKTLERMPPKPRLRPSLAMTGAAATHAVHSGITNTTGHSGFDTRMNLFQPFNAGKVTGENCYYGSKTALNITLSLLIDKGVPGLGHRKNILTRKFTRVGGSRFYHKQYTSNAVFDYSSANWIDLLLHVKPTIRQFGFNLGISQISDKPMLDIGLAYYANHMKTSNLLLNLNYQKGFAKNKSDAVSLYLGSGQSTGTFNNFLLGAKLQSYFNTEKANLYLQPELSWFAIISFFRNGYIYKTNDSHKSALYRISYGYNFRLINSAKNVYPHNVTVSRFISVKTKTK